MKSLRRLAAPVALLCCLVLAGCAERMEAGTADTANGNAMVEAKALFEKFVELGNDYDEAIADLYAEDAKILLIQERDGGEFRKVSVAGTDFKELVPRILPRAEEAGEQNTYSEVSYTPEGERVRIDAQRTATPHGFTVPHVLVVGPSRDSGGWLIYEEVAVTHL